METFRPWRPPYFVMTFSLPCQIIHQSLTHKRATINYLSGKIYRFRSEISRKEKFKHAILESRRELEPKSAPQVFLGWLLAQVSYWSIFSMSQVTVPETFAKVNLAVVPFSFLKWRAKFKTRNNVLLTQKINRIKRSLNAFKTGIKISYFV